MDEIEPYRQIVQLQQEIVQISHKNQELKKRCEQMSAELRLATGALKFAGRRSRKRPGQFFRGKSWKKLKARFERGIEVLRPPRRLRA